METAGMVQLVIGAVPGKIHMEIKRVTAAIISARPEPVRRCLESILNQTLDPDQYDILVVAQYGKPAIENSRIRWILNAPKSITTKRNICLREVKTEIIAFTDDDCFADSDWLKCGLEHLTKHPEACGVQGKINVPEPKDKNPNYSQARMLTRPFYQTSNIFYKVPDVQAVGGFDERFPFQREDVDLGFTLIKGGSEIGYEPAAQVTHPVRENEYWDLIKTAFRKRYDPLLVNKHPALFRKHFKRMIPGSYWFMYLLWVLFLAGMILCPLRSTVGIVLPLLGAFILTVRRHRVGWCGWKWVAASYISYLTAPFVTLYVILKGKIRYFGKK